MSESDEAIRSNGAISFGRTGKKVTVSLTCDDEAQAMALQAQFYRRHGKERVFKFEVNIGGGKAA